MTAVGERETNGNVVADSDKHITQSSNGKKRTRAPDMQPQMR